MKYKTVMLVDDNDVDNYLNERIIDFYKFAERVLVYSRSSEALEYLQTYDENKKEIPDVIFLDLDMPILNGFEFMEEFDKLDNSIKERTKIVMLTSSVNPDDKIKAKEIPNVIAFHYKPLKKQYLEELENAELLLRKGKLVFA